MRTHRGGPAGWKVLVSAFVLLLGAGSARDAAADAPPGPPAFRYELYCDAQGRFTYDGAALALVQRPSHLERVYAGAARGDVRAKELVRELEQEFHQIGVVVADTTTRPACLPLPELTPNCRPNWQFLREFLGDTREAERLRQVVAHAYEVRARERGLQNQVIAAGVNLLLAGAIAKGAMTQAATVEARGAAGQTVSTEASAAWAEAGRSAVAVRGGVDPAKFKYLFGEAGGRAHNLARTAQNAGQMARIGVYNTAEGRALLQAHFEDVVADPSNIVRTFTNQYGTFQIRESLFAGPGGFVKLESTWQVLEGGDFRFTTAIPLGGP